MKRGIVRIANREVAFVVWRTNELGHRGAAPSRILATCNAIFPVRACGHAENRSLLASSLCVQLHFPLVVFFLLIFLSFLLFLPFFGFQFHFLLPLLSLSPPSLPPLSIFTSPSVLFILFFLFFFSYYLLRFFCNLY